VAIDQPFLRYLFACGLILCPLLSLAVVPDDEEEEIELERFRTLGLELLNVEFPPSGLTEAIARYRISGGEFRGATLSLAYDYSRPIRLLSWDVHEVSGVKRIGGAKIRSQTFGQWESLFPPGADRPFQTLNVRLVQFDLNEDEKKRRWHFIRIDAIGPDELPPPEKVPEP
jgi:hypothetical protein